MNGTRQTRLNIPFLTVFSAMMKKGPHLFKKRAVVQEGTAFVEEGAAFVQEASRC